MDIKTWDTNMVVSFAQSFMGKATAHSVKVTLTQLVPNASTLNKPHVVLTRPPLPGQVSSDVVKTHARVHQDKLAVVAVGTSSSSHDAPMPLTDGSDGAAVPKAKAKPKSLPAKFRKFGKFLLA